MSKKAHLKELRRDEIGMAMAETAGQAVSMAKSHKLALMVGAAALLVVAVVASVWLFLQDRAETRAQAALGAALEKHDDLDRPDPNAVVTGLTWSDVATQFRAVAEEHDGTVAGDLADFHARVAALRAGESGSAEALDAWIAKHPNAWTTPQGLEALATAREDAGDVAGAEAALTKLKDGSWRNWPPGAADARLAQLLERHGRTDEAKAIWKRLSEDEKLEDTSYASLAKSRLDELGG